MHPAHEIPQHGNLVPAYSRFILLTYLNQVAQTISAKLTLDHTRDERGLTDDLIEELVRWDQTTLPESLHYEGWRLELRMSKVTQKLESQLGADLGLITTLSTRMCRVEKALLFQCKRLHPTGQSEFTPESCYGDLMEEHGRKQATDMLAHTPASFFLLFNPRISHVHNDLELINSKPLREDHGVSLHAGFQDILILPATTRIGMHSTGGLEDLFPYTTCFSQFIVQDVFQCNVGDASALALATARNKNEEFRVRISLEMDLLFED